MFKDHKSNSGDLKKYWDFMIYINHDKFVTLAAFLNLLINQFFLIFIYIIFFFFFLTNIKFLKIQNPNIIKIIKKDYKKAHKRYQSLCKEEKETKPTMSSRKIQKSSRKWKTKAGWV